MPQFQIVKHPDAIATIFVVTPDDDMNYEAAIRAYADANGGKLVKETAVQDGGMIYQFNFRDRSAAKKAMRDFKTARDFNLT